MKPNDRRGNDRDQTAEELPPSSPYGPHPGHVDEASGGADSSPHETLSSDEREETRARKREQEAQEDDKGRH